MDEERMRILKMLEEGKISAEEAAELLEALGERAEARPVGREGRARWFRVRVTDTKTGKKKVNLKIPLGVARMGMGMAAQFSGRFPGIDLDEVISEVGRGYEGQIVDVEDDEKGERVEVYVE